VIQIKGYTGKILRVDLSKNKTSAEPLNEAWSKKFIGGRGLAARYLFEELKPKTAPLSPENILIFMTGPVTGTAPHPPAAAKGVVVTKSPATHTFLDSYFGGNFMVEMKFAGFDGIIIHGKADKLSYLFLDDGNVEIRVAKGLKGKGVYETTDLIKEEIRDKGIKVAAIGPAGENLVKFACICFERNHQAGRGGTGAVMGSKNLKAVAVQGTKKVEVHDSEAWRELVKVTIKKEILENPKMESTRTSGTPPYVQFSNTVGILPTKNFQDGVFKDVDKIDSDAIQKNIFVKKTNCYRCPVACRNITRIRTGPFKGTSIDGPEYETLAMAGSNCYINDLNAIVKFNDLCDDYGLDTISAGNVTAFGMECFEKGTLSKKDLGGLDLSFGSVESYLKIPRLIALREGIGDTLAEGVKTASERIGKGSEKFALQAKGLEYPGYDPRGSFGMALAYATSDRGACHIRAFPVSYDAFGDKDPFTHEGKAKLCIGDQNYNSVKFSLIFCDFYPIGYPTMARFYSIATGRELKAEELELIGERIWNLTRAFNVREGFARKDDSLPTRIAREPLLSGLPKGRKLPREYFEKMLDDYYKERGWDNNGKPKEEKLRELELVEPVTS
jgi:aldehyde:ferredoxin oxidoreductase